MRSVGDSVQSGLSYAMATVMGYRWLCSSYGEPDGSSDVGLVCLSRRDFAVVCCVESAPAR